MTAIDVVFFFDWCELENSVSTKYIKLSQFVTNTVARKHTKTSKLVTDISVTNTLVTKIHQIDTICLYLRYELVVRKLTKYTTTMLTILS